MSGALVGLREAAGLLGCRDPRTARRRLADLGVPVLTVRRRLLVDPEDLRRAVRARSRPLVADGPRPAARRALAAGARLWDPRAPHDQEA